MGHKLTALLCSARNKRTLPNMTAQWWPTFQRFSNLGTGPELNFPGEAASSSMILQDGPILSDRELKKLKEHKYSSSCNTMLDPTMQKYELLTKPIGQQNITTIWAQCPKLWPSMSVSRITNSLPGSGIGLWPCSLCGWPLTSSQL